MKTESPSNSSQAKRKPIARCPVCKWEGMPECEETWNGIRGPGARVISRRWHCPQCGTSFAHPNGWTP